jgi:hypothetical protein
MAIYAQIGESGVVVGVSDLGVRGQVNRPDMIEIQSAGRDLLGMVYENGEFLPGPGPEPRTVLTRLEFISRFSDAELAAIYTAAKKEIALEIYLDKLRAAQDVTITDARTVAGVEALAAAGLIKSGRVAAILQPDPDA